MSHIAGADVQGTIRALREAGFSVREIASDLSLHVSTIYRWAAGSRTPRSTNLVALRDWVDAKFAQEANAQQLDRRKSDLLQAAFSALETDTDRTEREEIAARLRADMAERQRRDEEQAAQQRAEMARLRDSVMRVSQRKPRTSVIDQLADPFDAIQQDAGMRAVEAVFG